MLLENSEFLLQLEQLFKAQQTSGAVFLTQKRYTYVAPGEDTPIPHASTSNDELSYPVLLRATDGDNKHSKVKISTLVQPGDYDLFTTAYSSLLKSSLSSLRPKKKKKKSIPATGENKKSTKSPTTSTVFTPVKIIGPRRGAGVRKRRAAVRARQAQITKMFAKRKRDQEK